MYESTDAVYLQYFDPKRPTSRLGTDMQNMATMFVSERIEWSDFSKLHPRDQPGKVSVSLGAAEIRGCFCGHLEQANERRSL